MDKSTGNSESRDISVGCGPSSSPQSSDLATPPSPPPITLNIATTTGGNFTVSVDLYNSVDNVKKIIAKKLKVAKDRICLLHRERELQDGTVKDNGLMEGSKIFLIPNVETGLLAQRPENTVMQALESLNDSQVNDFLSGKTPLNLSMRLGDHMMLIQLQLSTVNPTSPSNCSRSRSSQRSSSRISASANPSALMNGYCAPSTSKHFFAASRKLDVDGAANNNRHNSSINVENTVTPTPSTSSARLTSLSSSVSTSSTSAATPLKQTSMDLGSFLRKHEIQNIVKSIALAQQQPAVINNLCTSVAASASTNITSNDDDLGNKLSTCCSSTNSLSTSFGDSLLDQSPIKSLSNLVSSPIKTSIKNIPISNVPIPTPTSKLDCPDPISAKLTSCLCKTLHNSGKACGVNCQSQAEVSTIAEFVGETKFNATSTPNCKNGSSSGMLHKTANNPIVRPRHRHHHQHHSSSSSGASTSGIVLRKSPNAEKIRLLANDSGISVTSANSSISSTDLSRSATTYEVDETATPAIAAPDTRALAEASRNLTQTLRKLSKEVFTNKIDLNNEEAPRKSGSGAVIESMKNHGKGIYSGTFSGTLNPALQDRFGRPKRDISTVIHILNDLLSATPQYSRGARISLDTPSTISTAPGSSMPGTKLTTISTSNPKTTPLPSCLKNSKLSSNCVYEESQRYQTANTQPGTPLSSSFSSRPLKSKRSVQFACCPEIIPYGNQSCVNLSMLDDRNVCSCRHRTANDTGEQDMCQKCSAEMENSKTKNKLEQLRLVLQQRKEKREARKLQCAPYRVLSTTSTTPTTAAHTPIASSPNDVNPTHIAEEVDTAA